MDIEALDTLERAKHRRQKQLCVPLVPTVGPEYLLIRPHTAGGDLVLLHAIGVHGLVTLPALMLTRTRLGKRARTWCVGGIAGSVILAMTVVATQAFRSLPWAQLGAPRLSLLTLASVVFVAAYALACSAFIRALLVGRQAQPDGPG